MAILEDLGLEVKIVVSNSPLQEYEDKEEDPTDDGFGDEIPKCRRYVEVVENAEFAVQLHATPKNEYLNENKMKWLEFSLGIDGQEDFEVRLVSSTKPETVEGKGERDGQNYTVHRFRFTAVSTVDDDYPERVTKHKEIARHLGLLRVCVWRVEVSERNEAGAALPDSSVPGDDTETKLSAAVSTEKALFYDVEYVDPVPLAIFYFKYRSKAALQEELVIPPSREPSSVDVGVDVDGLPLREIRRLARESLDILPLHEIRRLAQLRLLSGRRAAKEEVKREPGEDQISRRPRKFVKMSKGREAVDLTGDD